MEAGPRGRTMTHDLPRNEADNGEPVVPVDQRNWGPGGRPEHPELVVRWTPSTSLGWRAYHESMFPPGRLVTPDQVQGHEHRRQHCAAAVGPARGTTRGLRSRT